jgi:hypothetical protein
VWYLVWYNYSHFVSRTIRCHSAKGTAWLTNESRIYLGEKLHYRLFMALPLVEYSWGRHSPGCFSCRSDFAWKKFQIIKNFDFRGGLLSITLALDW